MDQGDLAAEEEGEWVVQEDQVAAAEWEDPAAEEEAAWVVVAGADCLLLVCHHHQDYHRHRAHQEAAEKAKKQPRPSTKPKSNLSKLKDCHHRLPHPDCRCPSSAATAPRR